MIFPWTPAQTRSLHFEKKADAQFARQKLRKAYQNYKKAAFFDESRQELLEKLLRVMEDFKDAWSEEDFLENIYWAMKLKELQDPTFKRIHFRAEPEFKTVTSLIQNMLKAKDTQTETEAVEAIAAHGDKAIYPLIEYLLTFKGLAQKPRQADQAKPSHDDKTR